jgi:hypothetical protein
MSVAVLPAATAQTLPTPFPKSPMTAFHPQSHENAGPTLPYQMCKAHPLPLLTEGKGTATFGTKQSPHGPQGEISKEHCNAR